jgi:hypothetical protein
MGAATISWWDEYRLKIQLILFILYLYEATFNMAILDDNNTFKRTSNTYRLVIMNDDTYDEVVAFRLSRTSVYIGFSVSFILLVGLTIALIAFTPLKYYIPGYGTKESQTALQLLKIRTDSLEQTLHYKEQYLEGIKKVLSEGNPKQLDTIPLKLPESLPSND